MNSSKAPGSSFDSFILSNLSNEKSNIEQFYESVLVKPENKISLSALVPHWNFHNSI